MGMGSLAPEPALSGVQVRHQGLLASLSGREATFAQGETRLRPPIVVPTDLALIIDQDQIGIARRESGSRPTQEPLRGRWLEERADQDAR